MYSTQSNRSISATPAKMNDRAQHERAEDAPEQHPVLVLLRHTEVRSGSAPRRTRCRWSGSSRSGSPRRTRRSRRRRTTTTTTSEKARPQPIHTADSIAASLVSNLVRFLVDDQEVDEQQRDDDRQQRTPVPGLDVEDGEFVACGALGGEQPASHPWNPGGREVGHMGATLPRRTRIEPRPLRNRRARLRDLSRVPSDRRARPGPALRCCRSRAPRTPSRAARSGCGSGSRPSPVLRSRRPSPRRS